MATSKVKVADKPTPIDTPRVNCLVTGEPIQFKQVGSYWIAYTSLWTSRPFDFLSDLRYALSYTGGEAPSYPRPGSSIDP